jgi:hypothetical protein
MTKITGKEPVHWHDATGAHRMPDPVHWQDFGADERAYHQHLLAHRTPEPREDDPDLIKLLFAKIALDRKSIATAEELIKALRRAAEQGKDISATSPEVRRLLAREADPPTTEENA